MSIENVYVNDRAAKIVDKYITFTHRDTNGFTADVLITFEELLQLLEAITPSIKHTMEDWPTVESHDSEPVTEEERAIFEE